MKLILNPLKGAGLSEDEALVKGEVADDPELPRALAALCPAYAATPLIASPPLAAALGIGALYLKDERGRMGLGSFKALGAAYAVAKAALRRVGERLSRPGVARTALEGETFITASAGNHGLSLAAGARVFGARAVIYLPETAPMDFAGRLADQGAVVEIRGADYEAAMEAAAEDAAREGWRLLSDSTWEGYARGVDVMEGYLIMAAEIVEAMEAPPSHIFLQAGVGGLAAAVAAYARRAWEDETRIVVVEPDRAACVMESVLADQPVYVTGPVSAMGRLDCKTPSHVALKCLAREADALIAISEEEGAAAAARLTEAGFATTPSGAAGFAGLAAARAEEALGLGPDSRCLVIVSEGPTGA